MATTISRRPRATSARGASYADTGYRETIRMPGGAGREVVDIQTPYGSGYVNRDSARTPARAADFNPEQVMAAAERIGLNRAMEQEAEESESLDRYRSFMRDSGINPDSIGTGRMVGEGSERRLAVAPIAVENAAREAMERDQAEGARYRVAANKISSRNPLAAEQLRQESSSLYPKPAGRSASGNLQYWINRVRGTSRKHVGNANGFSSPSRWNLNTAASDITL